MKRYSTLGMGPSQGKHSNLHGARILMRSRDATLADTALTTQRPFYHPVPLKHLAGMRFPSTSAQRARTRSIGGAGRNLHDGRWLAAAGLLSSGGSIACGLHRRRGERGARTAGLIDVRTLGKIEIFGPDAGAFLDRVYTGSFSDLRVGMTRYGLLLDEGGIVRDDGVIARLAEQHYYFTTTTGGAASVYRELLLWNTRWRMDCAFVNATGHRAAFNLAGPRSRGLLQATHRHRLVRVGVPVPRRARRPRRRRARRACCALASFPRWVSKFTFPIKVPVPCGTRS